MNCSCMVMDERQRSELLRIDREGIQFHRSMKEYTTFRIGGHADALYCARELGKLQRLISCLCREHIPYLVVGKGSNLLVKDNGFAGVVILMGEELARIEQEGEKTQILTVGGGLGLGELLRHCSKKGLGGLEFLAGIPGTVGGSVVMNAGAFGKDVGSVVQEIQMVTPQGDLATSTRAELAFSYRELAIPEGTVVVGATFRTNPESPKIVAKRVADYLARRKAIQPLQYPSAGSIFKNPPNDSAGRLIEKVGLKGKIFGGAMISPKHANYIVNTGGARARDVLALMELARAKVRGETGIELEPEIRVVGS